MPDKDQPTAPARNADGFAVQAIHLVRTATQANLTLSQMADQKASILMGATIVVFTLAVGQASRGEVSVTVLVLAAFAFISALLAIAAILPSVRPPDVPPDRQNLLFFGSFTQLTEDQFIERMLPQLTADERMFRVMLRDIYQNGRVLQCKKYRYLTFAYWVFLGGLCTTLLTLLIEQRAMMADLFG